ncbi:MAG TPA: DUF3768 domain-containing protein [Sphingomicrobium sp.]|nr:DUF3768 domain-containing protein [Sphingomicrobium sp.]
MRDDILAVETARHRIAQLNDALRINRIGGRILVSRGVDSLVQGNFSSLFEALATFDAFDPDNDPHGEHDFGLFEFLGVKLMWKIDYYDLELRVGSNDPSDPAVTTRVLTVFLAEEY